MFVSSKLYGVNAALTDANNDIYVFMVVLHTRLIYFVSCMLAASWLSEVPDGVLQVVSSTTRCYWLAT